MQPKDIYHWEIELGDRTILTNGNDFDFTKVVRVSYLPTINLLPRHDVILVNFKFQKRFARGLLNFRGLMREYIHCVVTDKFRFYLLSSSGKTIITDKDYELYT